MWTVDAHARGKGNWVLLINGDVEPFLIGNSVSLFSIPTKEFCLLRWLAVIASKPAYGWENLTYTFQALFWAMLIWKKFPHLTFN